MKQPYHIEWRDTSTGLGSPYVDDTPVSFDAVHFAEEVNRLFLLNAELLEALETLERAISLNEPFSCDEHERAKSAIAKARKEND